MAFDSSRPSASHQEPVPLLRATGRFRAISGFSHRGHTRQSWYSVRTLKPYLPQTKGLRGAPLSRSPLPPSLAIHRLGTPPLPTGSSSSRQPSSCRPRLAIQAGSANPTVHQGPRCLSGLCILVLLQGSFMLEVPLRFHLLHEGCLAEQLNTPSAQLTPG